MVPTCPECARPGIPLIFGLPAPEARLAAHAGQLALGGCLTPDGPPNWQCPDGHRWRNADEETFNARLLAVLLAHGPDSSIDDELLADEGKQ